MDRLRQKIFHDRSGISYLQGAVLTLAISFLFAVVLSYASIISIISVSRDSTRLVLDKFVASHQTTIFASVKEGTDTLDELDTEFFISTMQEDLSLDLRNGLLYSVAESGEIIFCLTTPVVSYNIENILNLKAQYDICIPVTFAGQQISQLTIPMEVTAKYTLK